MNILLCSISCKRKYTENMHHGDTRIREVNYYIHVDKGQNHAIVDCLKNQQGKKKKEQ